MIKVKVNFGHDDFTIEATVDPCNRQWRCSAHSQLGECIEGFGNTIRDSIVDFRSNVRNSQPFKYTEVKATS